MSVRADSWVDEYIGQLPDRQQAICQQVRQLVHAADQFGHKAAAG